MDRGAVGLVGATAVTATLLGTVVATGRTAAVGLVVGGAAVVAFLATGRPALVVLAFAVAVLVEPTAWPVVAAPAGVAVYVSDVLLVVVAVCGLLHRKRSDSVLTRRVLVLLLGLLLAWVAVRSTSAGSLAFARIAAPLGAGLIVSLAVPGRYDVLRPVRWTILAGCASLPVLGSTAGRWTSLAGGPNETALVAAAGCVVAVQQRSPLLGVSSLVVLAGTRSLSGATAAVAGVLVLVLATRGSALRKAGNLVLVGWLVVLAATVLPLLRPDVATTVAAHTYQAEQLGDVLAGGDLVLGAGWANVDAALFRSDVLGLHNVYLDVLAFSGLVGLVLLVTLLVVVWRGGDAAPRALLATWAVWVNTTGAFPGAAWGLLGLVLVAAVVSRSVGRSSEDRHRDRPVQLAPGSSLVAAG